MIYLMNGDGLLALVIIFYLLAHLPAFILLIIAAVKWKKSRETAKKLIIAAVIYFIIGAGVCGAMFM